MNATARGDRGEGVVRHQRSLLFFSEQDFQIPMTGSDDNTVFGVWV